MKPAPFAYRDPDTVDEVLELLAEHGDDAKLLAGGQSLGPMLNMRVVTPAVIVDLNRVRTLAARGLSAGASFALGALVRQAELEDDPGFAASQPLAAAALPWIAHRPIRNRGRSRAASCMPTRPRSGAASSLPSTPGSWFGAPVHRRARSPPRTFSPGSSRPRSSRRSCSPRSGFLPGRRGRAGGSGSSPAATATSPSRGSRAGSRRTARAGGAGRCESASSGSATPRSGAAGGSGARRRGSGSGGLCGRRGGGPRRGGAARRRPCVGRIPPSPRGGAGRGRARGRMGAGRRSLSTARHGPRGAVNR